MAQGLDHRVRNDGDFYRTLCLERIKDLFTKVRHLEIQAITAMSLSLVSASSIAAVFVYFHPHGDSLSLQKVAGFSFGILLFIGLLLLLLNSCYRKRAIAASKKVDELVSFLSAKGELLEDVPSISAGVIAPRWKWSRLRLRGRKLVFSNPAE